ncbi:hypothetical protein [Mycetocola lacteus]|uniref:hypothetical protein n=1 Tax=Mycetocola lacteus TaxID=76637 RepID=UPI001C7CA8A8|nr:hypothetical protein [Mycetocola lacteus]
MTQPPAITRLRGVPRTEAWVVCPRCGNAALIRDSIARCIHCTWSASGARAGHWCQCCTRWEGDVSAPVGDHYLAQVILECPRCGRSVTGEQRTIRTGRALPAEHCACGGTFTITEQRPLIHQIDGVDPLYGLPYFLSEPCAGHQLWIANREHADYLRAVLTGAHKPTDNELGNRLPGWMLRRHNRPAVLRSLDRLLTRDPGTPPPN